MQFGHTLGQGIEPEFNMTSLLADFQAILLVLWKITEKGDVMVIYQKQKRTLITQLG